MKSLEHNWCSVMYSDLQIRLLPRALMNGHKDVRRLSVGYFYTLACTTTDHFMSVASTPAALQAAPAGLLM